MMMMPIQQLVRVNGGDNSHEVIITDYSSNNQSSSQQQQQQQQRNTYSHNNNNNNSSSTRNEVATMERVVDINNNNTNNNNNNNNNSKKKKKMMISFRQSNQLDSILPTLILRRHLAMVIMIINSIATIDMFLLIATCIISIVFLFPTTTTQIDMSQHEEDLLLLELKFQELQQNHEFALQRFHELVLQQGTS